MRGIDSSSGNPNNSISPNNLCDNSWYPCLIQHYLGNSSNQTARNQAGFYWQTCTSEPKKSKKASKKKNTELKDDDRDVTYFCKTKKTVVHGMPDIRQDALMDKKTLELANNTNASYKGISDHNSAVCLYVGLRRLLGLPDVLFRWHSPEKSENSAYYNSDNSTW